MHKPSSGRAIERHPTHQPGFSSMRAPQAVSRDPEPLALSPAEIRRIVLDLIG
jgi:hypothetical protein